MSVPSHGDALLSNPFWILGVSVRDTAARIVERAEERALELEADICNRARAALTVPRSRLSAEIGWLPGLSPRRASQVVESLIADPGVATRSQNLPLLARANVIAAAVELTPTRAIGATLSDLVLELASLVEAIVPDEVATDINEDRAIAGFPPIRELDFVVEELSRRREAMKNAVVSVLSELSTVQMIAKVTEIVDRATEQGTKHANALLDSIVSAYEVEAHQFLTKEADNVRALASEIVKLGQNDQAGVAYLVQTLESAVRNWDRVAQPIQVLAKANGLRHDASSDLARDIRRLSLTLFNDMEMPEHSRSLTALLGTVFAEVPQIAEQSSQDAAAIEENLAARREREKEITYDAEVGLLAKGDLKISARGVSWCQQHFALDEITRVAWGGVRHSVNGIPTGTNYTIKFGNDHDLAVVSVRRKEVYEGFTKSLWKAVGADMVHRLAAHLRRGGSLKIGNAVVFDRQVILKKHGWFRSEDVTCPWSNVKVWSQDGSFFIGSDKSTYSSASYINDDNTHVLETLVRLAFDKSVAALSDIFQF